MRFVEIPGNYDCFVAAQHYLQEVSVADLHSTVVVSNGAALEPLEPTMTPAPLRAVKFASVVVSALLSVGCASAPALSTRTELGLIAPAVPGTPPGAVNGEVTQTNIQQNICVPGWSATVRPSTSYTNAIKARMLKDRGLPASDASKYELDHFIPLTLGGHPRSPDNLWLQAWDGQWGAKTKDRLEVKLKTLVCNGTLTLRLARDTIRRNWIEAFKRYVDFSEAGVELTEPID